MRSLLFTALQAKNNCVATENDRSQESAIAMWQRAIKKWSDGDE